MVGESIVTRSIIDELNSQDIQGDQTEGEGYIIRKIIDEPHSWDIQGDQKDPQSAVT